MRDTCKHCDFFLIVYHGLTMSVWFIRLNQCVKWNIFLRVKIQFVSNKNMKNLDNRLLCHTLVLIISNTDK